MKSAIILFFFTSILILAQQQKDSAEAEMTRKLQKLNNFHSGVKDIHMYLEKLQPVAVVDGNMLLLFDADTSTGSYIFIKKVPAPFPMGDNIRAAFPFSEYNFKPVCFVGKSAFENKEEMSVVLHEFVHCAQFNSVEQELKNKLNIYKDAMEKERYSWEIDHSFAYDSVFLSRYELFNESLLSENNEAAVNYRNDIRNILSGTDFEYMIWQEWKEGLARYLENEIRIKSGIKENNGGRSYPADRVVFYYGGSTLIRYLESRKEGPCRRTFDVV
jgi:hypothetical protein